MGLPEVAPAAQGRSPAVSQTCNTTFPICSNPVIILPNEADIVGGMLLLRLLTFLHGEAIIMNPKEDRA